MPDGRGSWHLGCTFICSPLPKIYLRNAESPRAYIHTQSVAVELLWYTLYQHFRWRYVWVCCAKCQLLQSSRKTVYMVSHAFVDLYEAFFSPACVGSRKNLSDICTPVWMYVLKNPDPEKSRRQCGVRRIHPCDWGTKCFSLFQCVTAKQQCSADSTRILCGWPCCRCCRDTWQSSTSWKLFIMVSLSSLTSSVMNSNI